MPGSLVERCIRKILTKEKKMKNTLSKFFPLKNDEFRIFLFHGVIKKNKSIIRNYNNKHIIQKSLLIH